MNLTASQQVTLTTLGLFSLGFILTFSHWAQFLCLLGIALLYAGSRRSEDPSQTLKIWVTMFLFGVLDGKCVVNLSLGSVYLIVLTVYHYGEFQLVNCFHHSHLSWSSFLIYHSPQYTIANVACLTEHILTGWVFCFEYKQYHFLVPVGLFLMLSGLVIRICAFFTARSNFTHIVQTEKATNHRLVTHGIFKYFRHPSYFGFFYFSVGSMMFLGNFVCLFLFAYVLHDFFKHRISREQSYLIQFFGEEYLNYRRRTPTRMFFIP